MDTSDKLPPYRRMITLALKQRESGCSLISIYKYLESTWSVPKSKRTFIRKALAKGTILHLWTKRKSSYKLIKTPVSKRLSITSKVKIRSKPKPIKPITKPINQPSTINIGATSMIWTWQFSDNGWCNYHPDASKVVEATYQDYLRNPGVTDVRSVQSGDWNYMVDFRQMTQQNIQHENHTVRQIRRVLLPIDQTCFRQRFSQ